MASASEQFFMEKIVETVASRIDKLADETAKAKEAASKQSEAANKSMLKHHEVIAKNLGEFSQCFEFLNSKVSCLELRQCSVFGEGTDAARMWAQWAEGENANPSPESLEKLRQSILTTKSASGTSYQGIFGVKDMARSESMCARFIEQALEGKKTSPSFNPSEDNVGAILTKMPLFRGEIMRAHDKKFLENNKGEMPTEKFEEIFPELSESDRALFQLIMPVGKKLEPLNSRELDRGRHNARRTRVSPEDPHPFELEDQLEEDELYNRVDEKARKIIEAMPGLSEVSSKRRRVTQGVVFWGEYYLHKFNAELQDEHREWEHNEKVNALLKSETSLSSRT